MIINQKWIRAANIKNAGQCPVFVKTLMSTQPTKAMLTITARGVYYAELNHQRVGNFILAPGYTEYLRRLQYQTYDITELIHEGENRLEISLASGWYSRGPWSAEIIGEILLEYPDGTSTVYGTDSSWLVGDGPLVFAEWFDGEIYDATKPVGNLIPAWVNEEAATTQLIPQEGEMVIEQERFSSMRIFKTPKYSAKPPVIILIPCAFSGNGCMIWIRSGREWVMSALLFRGEHHQ